jgi:hypothetical protein
MSVKTKGRNVFYFQRVAHSFGLVWITLKTSGLEGHFGSDECAMWGARERTVWRKEKRDWGAVRRIVASSHHLLAQ